MAATDNETEAATGPIVVPTSQFVNGNKKTSKIIKGMDRIKLMTIPTIPFIHLFSKNNPWSVTNNVIPKGNPSKTATNNAIPTIKIVWKKARFNSGKISRILSILYHLHYTDTLTKIINCSFYFFFLSKKLHDENAKWGILDIFNFSVEDISFHCEGLKHVGHNCFCR